jgi:hypothetical protein
MNKVTDAESVGQIVRLFANAFGVGAFPNNHKLLPWPTMAKLVDTEAVGRQ